jgi:hypothetical protein
MVWEAMEWAREPQQIIPFLNIDIDKAYERID